MAKENKLCIRKSLIYLSLFFLLIVAALYFTKQLNKKSSLSYKSEAAQRKQTNSCVYIDCQQLDPGYTSFLHLYVVNNYLDTGYPQYFYDKNCSLDTNGILGAREWCDKNLFCQENSCKKLGYKDATGGKIYIMKERFADGTASEPLGLFKDQNCQTTMSFGDVARYCESFVPPSTPTPTIRLLCDHNPISCSDNPEKVYYASYNRIRNDGTGIGDPLFFYEDKNCIKMILSDDIFSGAYCSQN